MSYRIVEQRAAPMVARIGAGAVARALPNALTLSGYGLGLWWCVGGPTWAGIASIVLDEVDGRVARATDTTSPVGAELDWGADVALVPLSLLRLGRAAGVGPVAVAAAPPVLLYQASLRASGGRPALGSFRAAIMVGAMLLEHRR